MPRKLLLVCSALTLLSGATCVPSTEELEEFGENSPMAAIQEEGELVVAVPENAPPFSSADDTGEPQGLVVDLAADLADALEVEVSYVEASSEEMAELVAGPDPVEIGDEEAHLAFPLTTVTYEIYRDRSRVQGFDLTTPFFLAHQRLLVPTGAGISDADDLDGKTVCTLLDDALGVPLEQAAPQAEEQAATSAEDCVSSLGNGDVDAAMAAETDLLQMLARLDARGDAGGFEVVGDQLTTQGFAPFVVKGMAAFSSDVFTEAHDDGRWSDAYERWVTPLNEREAEPPDLTLQEAAAFYPIED